jgi:hypothetical protein
MYMTPPMTSGCTSKRKSSPNPPDGIDGPP